MHITQNVLLMILCDKHRIPNVSLQNEKHTSVTLSTI